MQASVLKRRSDCSNAKRIGFCVLATLAVTLASPSAALAGACSRADALRQAGFASDARDAYKALLGSAPELGADRSRPERSSTSGGSESVIDQTVPRCAVRGLAALKQSPPVPPPPFAAATALLDAGFASEAAAAARDSVKKTRTQPPKRLSELLIAQREIGRIQALVKAKHLGAARKKLKSLRATLAKTDLDAAAVIPADLDTLDAESPICTGFDDCIDGAAGILTDLIWPLAVALGIVLIYRHIRAYRQAKKNPRFRVDPIATGGEGQRGSAFTVEVEAQIFGLASRVGGGTSIDLRRVEKPIEIPPTAAKAMPQSAAVQAILEFVQLLFKPRELVLSGSLQPRTATTGTGVSLVVVDNASQVGSAATLRSLTFGVPPSTAPAVGSDEYDMLVDPAAVWALFQNARRAEGPAGSEDEWFPVALLFAGLRHQQQGQFDSALQLYSRARMTWIPSPSRVSATNRFVLEANYGITALKVGAKPWNPVLIDEGLASLERAVTMIPT